MTFPDFLTLVSPLHGATSDLVTSGTIAPDEIITTENFHAYAGKACDTIAKEAWRIDDDTARDLILEASEEQRRGWTNESHPLNPDFDGTKEYRELFATVASSILDAATSNALQRALQSAVQSILPNTSVEVGTISPAQLRDMIDNVMEDDDTNNE